MAWHHRLDGYASTDKLICSSNRDVSLNCAPCQTCPTRQQLHLYESTITGLYVRSLFRSWLLLQSCVSINISTTSSPLLAFYSLACTSRPCALAPRLYLEHIQKATSAESLNGICVCNLGFMRPWISFVQAASGASVTTSPYSVTIFILYCQECSTLLTLSISKGPGSHRNVIESMLRC